MKGATSADADARARVAARLAVGLGLLCVGLGVGSVVLAWRATAEEGLLSGILGDPWATDGVPFAVMGALICARRPWNRIGWLMVTAALSATAFEFASWLASYTHLVPTGWVATSIWVPAPVAIMFLLLLYPTGRLVSQRWRPVAWAAGAWGILAVLAMALNPELADPDLSNPIGLRGVALGLLTKAIQSGVALGSLIVLLLVCLLSLLVRFRRARGVERQQLKWLVYAASLAIATAFLPPLYWWAGGILPRLSVWAIPVAIGIAVLRYRLYDIDRIIRRTVTYGILTVVLGLGYVALVVGLGQVLGQHQSSLVVAGATLAVAAVFQPARRGIQNVVDRRFDRRRYDAGKTIEAFSARLRDQVDLDTLIVELLAVVNQTVQPTAVSLWLRPQAAPPRQPAPARHPEPG